MLLELTKNIEVSTIKNIYTNTKNFEKYCLKHKEEIINLNPIYTETIVNAFNNNLQLKTLLHRTIISNFNSPLWEITPIILDLIRKTNPLPLSQSEIIHTIGCIKTLPKYQSKYNKLLEKLVIS
jgi:hypothetical protein